MRSFEDRWTDPRFRSQSTIFLSKFTRPLGDKPIENPALLCRKGKKLDGERPSDEELRALELSLAFGFLDANPTQDPDDRQEAWGMVTAENVELFLWPIDLEQGCVSLRTGYLVQVRTGGFTLGNPWLVLTPPLDLHMPIGAPSPDPLILTGIYDTVLHSLRSPGTKPEADRVRVAVEWFTKAWQNTATVHYPERLVFLKTAFEALTGTSNTHRSAKSLRHMFEELQDTTEHDSDVLVWSPEEKPVHSHTWKDRGGQLVCSRITDLEAWFMAFSRARNSIIHEGKVPDLTYPNSNSGKPIASRSVYHYHLFFTAERLLRGTVKVVLSRLGYNDAWRSRLWRSIQESMDDADIRQLDEASVHPTNNDS